MLRLIRSRKGNDTSSPLVVLTTAELCRMLRLIRSRKGNDTSSPLVVLTTAEL